MAVSFIGGRNQSTRRKPPTCGKSMTNLMLYQVHLAMNVFSNIITSKLNQGNGGGRELSHNELPRFPPCHG